MAKPRISALRQLHEVGQSVWLDYIRRGMLRDGELRKLIDEDGIRGLTSNPTIFAEAMGSGEEYEAAFQALAVTGDRVRAYEAVAAEDIQGAADLFLPLYEETAGGDGYVSLEVAPTLAHDTQGTLDEAHRLWKAVDRPNLMIKVPGTPEGLPVVEALLREGINVNITLLFSLASYEQVMEAYLRALEARREAGQPLDRVASVASFFISRVDTAVDKMLEERVAAATNVSEQERLRGMLGKTAIANAALAYSRFREVFRGERWERLRTAGARLQRPLWASTSTKNPAYRDVIYVEALIAPDTVNTMPLATVRAFADHGVTKTALTPAASGARLHLEALRNVGIDLDQVTATLQTEGVQKFATSFDELLGAVEQRLAQVAGAA